MGQKVVWMMDAPYHEVDGLKGKRYKLVVSSNEENHSGFFAADNFFRSPKELTIDFLLEKISEHRVDVVIPRKQEDQVKIAQWISEGLLEEDKFLFNNKITMIDVFSLKDVSIPPHKHYGSISEFHQIFSQHHNDVVLCAKGKCGFWGVFDTTKYSPKKYRELFEKIDSAGILMEYLDGDQVTVECAAYKGQLIGVSVRIQPKDKNYQIIDNNKYIIHEAEQLTKELNMHGLFHIKMKNNKNNNKVFVVDVKNHLSDDYYLTAGINLQNALLDVALGYERVDFYVNNFTELYMSNPPLNVMSVGQALYFE